MARGKRACVVIGVAAATVALVYQMWTMTKPRPLGGPIAIVPAPEFRAKGFLGIDYETAPEDWFEPAGAWGGVLVTRVLAGSPAAAAGIAVDDVLVVADGVQVRSREELLALSAKWKPHAVVRLTLIRDEAAAPDPVEKSVDVRLISFDKIRELMTRQATDP